MPAGSMTSIGATMLSRTFSTQFWIACKRILSVNILLEIFTISGDGMKKKTYTLKETFES